MKNTANRSVANSSVANGSTANRSNTSSRIPDAKPREYWRVMVIHKWVIILGFIIVLASTFLYLRLETPEYQAAAVLMSERETNPAISLFESGRTISASPALDDQRQLLKSSFILNEVINQISQQDPMISTIELGNRISLESKSASVFTITATADNPKEAAILANTMADVYIAKMSELRSTDLDQAEGSEVESGLDVEPDDSLAL